MANQKITDETVIQLIAQSEDSNENSVFLYQGNAKNLIEKHLGQLVDKGIAAKVLIPGKNWQTGKLKIVVEFQPDPDDQYGY